MRTILWITLTTIALGYLIFAYATIDRTDDQAQINTLLSQVKTALQNRDLNGAISCVSKQYKDPNGMKYNNLRALTAQALRTEQKYKVAISLKSSRIIDNAATLDLILSINSTDGGGILYKRNLTVILAKEKGWHGVIIPVKYWKVTSIDGLGLSLQE